VGRFSERIALSFGLSKLNLSDNCPAREEKSRRECMKSRISADSYSPVFHRCIVKLIGAIFEILPGYPQGQLLKMSGLN
jgi:hypothetical protein